MTIVSEMQEDFNQILKYGDQLRFKYYNQTIAVSDYYDDDTTLTQSGNDLWTSGLIQPIGANSDSLLLQQGKLLIDDKKMFVLGIIQTSGLAQIKIGLGSPIRQEYQILGQGQVTEWSVNGSPVYKKIFARVLNNGSFVGE